MADAGYPTSHIDFLTAEDGRCREELPNPDGIMLWQRILGTDARTGTAASRAIILSPWGAGGV